MRIAFHTLGCKVNQFETQALELMLSERGHTVTDDFSSADVIVINTCTVTATSDMKSRRAIRHFQKEYPNAKTAVCGCMTQTDPDSAKRLGASVVAGTADRKEFCDAIDRLLSEQYIDFTVTDVLRRRDFELLPAGGLFGHTRALLKIEDGCTNFCTYCIIPYSRGPVRSMPVDAVLSEAARLADSGYKEVVITGIEISSYGRDLSPKCGIADITALLCKTFPNMRFRLGSLEPRTVDEDFCVKLRSFTNLCPHFHLSMQSGCDETLLRMHRKYDTARFYKSVALLKDSFKDCAVTTDMIVGFPGEDEEEFLKSLDFIKKCAFADMHIFPYSKRDGTPAAAMPNQLTRAEKSERSKRAISAAKAMTEAFLTSQLGKKLSVLFEEESDGFITGHSKNYIKVYVKSDKSLKNVICDVCALSLFRDGVLAELI